MSSFALPRTELAAAAAEQEPDLRALFGQLAAGQASALDAIYDHTAADLYGYAVWCTNQRQDAADVVQEVFVKLATTTVDLGAVRDPRAYLRVMTRRTALDLTRRQSRQRAREVPADSATALFDVPAGPAADPARARDAARASRLAAGLPRGQREALYLRCYAGLSFADIGKTTGVPTFTAASRFRLAIARLRRALGVTS